MSPQNIFMCFQKPCYEILTEPSHDEKLRGAATYFIKSKGQNKHYAWYTVCEILNLLTIITIYWLTDWFLQGDFASLGWDWLRYVVSASTEKDEINPMEKVFPKVTKCEFRKYGPSGSIVTYDIMCVLTLNIINEKIFLFFWMFLVTFFFLDIMLLVRSAFFVGIPTGRRYFLLRKCVRGTDRDALRYFVNQLSYSDWFLLQLILDNIDPIDFGKFCRYVEEGFNKEEKQDKAVKYGYKPGKDEHYSSLIKYHPENLQTTKYPWGKYDFRNFRSMPAINSEEKLEEVAVSPNDKTRIEFEPSDKDDNQVSARKPNLYPNPSIIDMDTDAITRLRNTAGKYSGS